MTEMPGQEDPAFRRSDRASRRKSRAAASRLGGATPSNRASRSAATKPPVFFVVLVVLVVVKAWLMRGFALGAWNPLGAAVFETALLVLIMGLADILPPRRWYWLDLAVYSAICTLLFAMTVYVRFYAQLFDPHMLAMAGQLGSVADAVAELIKPVYLLFFIDVPLLVVWVVMLGRRSKRQQERLAATPNTRARTLIRPTKRSLPVAIVTLVAVVVAIGQLVSAAQVPREVDGVAIAKARGLAVAQAAVFLPRPPEDAEVAPDVVAPGAIASSVPTASVPATVSQTPGGKTQARVERIRGALNGSRIATFAPGAYRGKSVIVVQVEALNTMVMQKTFEGHVITPNLNAILADSWYFPNTYSETGIGNTADAEFIVNASLFAPRSQAASVVYADRKIPALPRLLEKQGYETFTMHQNRVAFWNRKELYASLGFSRYYDSKFFGNSDHMGIGCSDEVMLKKAAGVLKSKRSDGAPFYAQIITLSAHTPFNFVPPSRRPFEAAGENRSTLMGGNISVEAYTDMALGKFISALKSQGSWDDSIVVFYGDHTAMMDNKLDGRNAELARGLLGREYGPADRQRIPLIIHLPGQKAPVVNEDIVAQVDIMPTIADILGLDLTEVPHMGRSAFVKSNALVPFNSYLPGGSFANDSLLFMPGLGFDDGSAVRLLDSSDTAPTPTEERDYKRMLALTKISNSWTMSLPKRKDAGSLEDAWIPNAKAREAAEALDAKKKKKRK
jgi:lipoteichoic acid synthase